MAYVIPVAALLLDEVAAAAAINEPANYFDDYNNDRYDGVDRLAKLTGAPVTYFADEDEDIYYIGLHIEDDWRIDIDAALLAKAATLKAQHPHPLIQSATLAVVSQFN